VTRLFARIAAAVRANAGAADARARGLLPRAGYYYWLSSVYILASMSMMHCFRSKLSLIFDKNNINQFAREFACLAMVAFFVRTCAFACGRVNSLNSKSIRNNPEKTSN
jgi:hypothetical protein